VVNFTVTEESPADIEDYARIPMSLEVREIFQVTTIESEHGRFSLSKRSIPLPYVKDYDALENPQQWSRCFDLSNWGFLVASSDGLRIGGAALAFDTPALEMLEDRRDMAVLWDIRVSPQMRGKGVGTALFKAAEAWSRTKGCRQLKVETQNINVPACRFYAKQGCVLCEIHPHAYREFPDEVQLLWYKDLGL
jgi:GNAT superfamily N-acetyltransferase